MSLIEMIIEPRAKDLGSFEVRRILPYAKRRMVGPFIFLDHMGPAHFASGQGMDVRPHPHINLATVTYLFEGEIFHRDTIGSAQNITPGAVNWMTAGRGISHSERTPPAERSKPHNTHGLQSWVALPKEFEEVAPEFFHHEADKLPAFSVGNSQLKLIAGKAYGHLSPVKTYSPLFYIEVHMPAGAVLDLPKEYKERALYLIKGKLRIGNTTIEPIQFPIFEADENIRIESIEPSHFILKGGEPFPEERYMWWNFVSSSKDRLVQAQEDWKNGRFGLIPGDDKEFIPLPDTGV